MPSQAAIRLPFRTPSASGPARNPSRANVPRSYELLYGGRSCHQSFTQCGSGPKSGFPASSAANRESQIALAPPSYRMRAPRFIGSVFAAAVQVALKCRPQARARSLPRRRTGRGHKRHSPCFAYAAHAKIADAEFAQGLVKTGEDRMSASWLPNAAAASPRPRSASKTRNTCSASRSNRPSIVSATPHSR